MSARLIAVVFLLASSVDSASASSPVFELPEPSSLATLAAGMVAVYLARRKS